MVLFKEIEEKDSINKLEQFVGSGFLVPGSITRYKLNLYEKYLNYLNKSSSEVPDGTRNPAPGTF